MESSIFSRKTNYPVLVVLSLICLFFLYGTFRVPEGGQSASASSRRAGDNPVLLQIKACSNNQSRTQETSQASSSSSSYDPFHPPSNGALENVILLTTTDRGGHFLCNFLTSAIHVGFPAIILGWNPSQPVQDMMYYTSQKLTLWHDTMLPTNKLQEEFPPGQTLWMLSDYDVIIQLPPSAVKPRLVKSLSRSVANARARVDVNNIPWKWRSGVSRIEPSEYSDDTKNPLHLPLQDYSSVGLDVNSIFMLSTERHCSFSCGSPPPIPKPDDADCPYAWLNSGAIIVDAPGLLSAYHELREQSTKVENGAQVQVFLNDQELVAHQWAAGYPFLLDYANMVMINIHQPLMDWQGHLYLVDGQIINVQSARIPVMAHFNGFAKHRLLGDFDYFTVVPKMKAFTERTPGGPGREEWAYFSQEELDRHARFYDKDFNRILGVTVKDVCGK